MPLSLAVLFALVGLVAGSFVNLVAQRMPVQEPIVVARSRAECCGRALGPSELIPLVSWLVQRGRCVSCGDPVSPRHPVVELLGAGIGVWAVLSSGSPQHAALTALLGWQLLLISLIDGATQWLPDRLTLALLATGLVAAGGLPEITLRDAILGALVGYLALSAVRLIYLRVRRQEGLGDGDPILFAAAGAWVGWAGLPSTLLWACAAGLSWAGARALAKRPLRATEPVAFGPFLALGIWLTWILGPLGL